MSSNDLLRSSGSSPASGSSAWLAPEFVHGSVSVIIPTHNRAAWLPTTLASLRAQTWRSLEVIVVDDGSTDDTLRVLELLPPLGEGRTLRTLTQPNAGCAAARNLGTRAATGEFIIYLDSDDLLVPDAIEHYVTALHRSDADYCFAAIDSIDEHGHPIPDKARWHPYPATSEDLFTNFWLIHAGCYRREVVARVGPWNENLRCGEDTEFILRIKSTGRGTHLPRVQGFYRYHGPDQLHRIYKMQFTVRPQLPMLDGFATWLRQNGLNDPVVTRLVVKQYRFVAARLGAEGDMDGKNQALLGMHGLLIGTWSPRRLYMLGLWVNSTWAYESAIRVKRKLNIWRKGILRRLRPDP